MNQKQREFLIDKVRENYKAESHGKEKPEKPSLSNYIIAAVLDGSLQLRPADHMKAVIKKRVLKMSEKDNSMFGSSRRAGRYDDDDDDQIFEISPKDFFELPEDYLKAWKEYEVALREYNKWSKDLSAMRDTLVLKIQIGSDKILDKLIEEADNLADLSLMQTQLILKSGGEIKSLTDGKK